MSAEAPFPLADIQPVPFDAAREATRLFRLAADDAYAVTGLVGGLREIVAAGAHGDLFHCDPDALAELQTVLAAAYAPATAVVPSLPPVAFLLGMGAAAGLVREARLPADHREPPELLCDRLDHAALLADQLDADFRRRRIEARGDLLRRHVRIAIARDTPASGQPIQ